MTAVGTTAWRIFAQPLSARARRASRAFTLIEIMIVVVIVGILVAVAAPSMRKFNESNRLKTLAREITSKMRYARTEAIFTERVTEMFLDIEKQEYWVDLRRDAPDESDSSDSNDRDRKRKKSKSKKSDMEDKSPLDESSPDYPRITFGDVLAYDENIIKGNLIAIDFFPDGSASPTIFTIKNTSGHQMCIEVLKATGFTEITPGTIEEKQEKSQSTPQVVLPQRAGGSEESY